MTELTQGVLRDILSVIFDIDEDYIVLKQGNWFGAQAIQDLNDNKPMTWIRYRILDDIPLSTPGYDTDYDEDSNLIEVIVTQVFTPIELDFIGTRAEECAKSIRNWPLRTDVQSQFESVGAKVMMTDRRVSTFDYIQEGLNNNLAYNSNFKLARKSVIPTGATLIDDTWSVQIEGSTINE